MENNLNICIHTYVYDLYVLIYIYIYIYKNICVNMQSTFNFKRHKMKYEVSALVLSSLFGKKSVSPMPRQFENLDLEFLT